MTASPSGQDPLIERSRTRGSCLRDPSRSARRERAEHFAPVSPPNVCAVTWWRVFVGLGGVSTSLQGLFATRNDWGDKAFFVPALPFSVWLLYTGVEPAVSAWLDRRRGTERTLDNL